MTAPAQNKKPVDANSELEKSIEDYMVHSTHGMNREQAELQVLKAKQFGKKIVLDGKELEFA